MQAPGQHITAAMSPEAWFAAHLHSVTTGGAHGSYAGRPVLGSTSTAMPGTLQAVQAPSRQHSRASVPASGRHAVADSVGSAAAPSPTAVEVNGAPRGGVAEGAIDIAGWPQESSNTVPDAATQPDTAGGAAVWDAAPPASQVHAPPRTHAASPSSAAPTQAPLLAHPASLQAGCDRPAASGAPGAASAGLAARNHGRGVHGGTHMTETEHADTTSEPQYEEVWYVEDDGAAQSGECGGAAALPDACQEAFSGSAASAGAGRGLGRSAAVPPPDRVRTGVDRRAHPDARLPRRLAAADLRLRPGVDDDAAAVLAWALGAAHFRPDWRMEREGDSTSM